MRNYEFLGLVAIAAICCKPSSEPPFPFGSPPSNYPNLEQRRIHPPAPATQAKPVPPRDNHPENRQPSERTTIAGVGVPINADKPLKNPSTESTKVPTQTEPIDHAQTDTQEADDKEAVKVVESALSAYKNQLLMGQKHGELHQLRLRSTGFFEWRIISGTQEKKRSGTYELKNGTATLKFVEYGNHSIAGSSQKKLTKKVSVRTHKNSIIFDEIRFRQ